MLRMSSTAGPILASAVMKIHRRPGIAHAGWSAIPISTTTANGNPHRITAICGSRESMRDGLRITMDIGHGSILGDGPGWTMSPGDTRRSTMADGRTGMTAGDGCRGHEKSVRYTLPLWLRSSAEHLWQGRRSRGFRSVRAKFMCLRIA